jgi:radical SAM superfamily enzyme YgiQ (UPF0313 family)
VNRKIYLIQPSYRDNRGRLLKGKSLYVISLALPALSATIPPGWAKEFCYEYFDEVNFDSDASVIGISSMGYEIFRGVEIAAEFKKRGKTVIFGGFQPHISSGFLEGRCDSIVHGNPGPADMAAILRDAESHTLRREYFCKPDLSYRFDYSVIGKRKITFMPVLLGVGCRNWCDYCCIGHIYEGKYHLRKFEHVIEELEFLRRTTRKIAFVDTNMYNNRELLLRVCDAMIDRNFSFIWGGQCTIDIGDDPEILRRLKKSGCRVLFIGMESVEQTNLDAVHKKYKADSYREKLENIHAAGIKIAGFFMYGLDGDTVGTAARLSTFIRNNRIALPMLNVLVPTPGTKLYDRLKDEGRILMNDELDFLKNNIAYNSSFNLCFYEPKNMTPAQVEEGFVDLLGSLSGIRDVIRRSVSTDIPLSLYLLCMNLSFRKEFIRLRNLRSVRGSSRSQGVSVHGPLPPSQHLGK